MLNKRKNLSSWIIYTLTMIFIIQSTLCLYAAANDSDLETNMSGWVGLNFDKKTDYGEHKVTGNLVAGIAYDWTVGSYTTSDTAPDGTKSFTLDTSFTLYDAKLTAGAQNGWSEAGVILGASSREEVHVNSNMFSISHLTEEAWENSNFRYKENNTLKESVLLTKEQYDANNYNMFFTYDAESQTLTVKLNDAQIMVLDNAKDIVSGNIGFVAMWNTMKVTKAIYTEVDGTPEPTTVPNTETDDSSVNLYIILFVMLLSVTLFHILNKSLKKEG